MGEQCSCHSLFLFLPLRLWIKYYQQERWKYKKGFTWPPSAYEVSYTCIWGTLCGWTMSMVQVINGGINDKNNNTLTIALYWYTLGVGWDNKISGNIISVTVHTQGKPLVSVMRNFVNWYQYWRWGALEVSTKLDLIQWDLQRMYLLLRGILFNIILFK